MMAEILVEKYGYVVRQACDLLGLTPSSYYYRSQMTQDQRLEADLKAMVLRYGGVNRFKEVRILFIGLVVGDMIMAIFWLTVGFFTSISYHALPL